MDRLDWSLEYVEKDRIDKLSRISYYLFGHTLTAAKMD